MTRMTRTMLTHRGAPAALVMLAAVLAVGCGREDPPAEPATTDEPTVDATTPDPAPVEVEQTPDPAADATRYTPRAEHRAQLLQAVRYQEQAMWEAKEAGPAVTLVDAGNPVATIVVADTADDAANNAAADAAELLNDWLERMSGATLPIADEADGDGPAVYLGQAALDAGLEIDHIDSDTDEGIRVRVDGEHVHIAWQAGADPARAIGRFLEEQFGARWIATRPWGRIHPERDTLVAHGMDLEENPAARFRRIWGAQGAFGGAPGWLGWVGHGGQEISMSHSWGFLHDVDFDEHPDWFRMNEQGERVEGDWPNFGNPELREHFIQWALEQSDYGQRDSISLSPPDGYRFDHSPEAERYDDPDSIDPTSGRVSMTNRFVGIVNEAAERIWEHGQNTVIGFYAYSDYTLPPTLPELEELSPNLAVFIAPIRFSRYHPLGHLNSDSRQLLQEIIDGWGRAAHMLGYREYNFNLADGMLPFSKISVWAHDIPYFHQRGGIAYNLESFDSWELSAPHLYLSIRLAYDPTLDPWHVMADYWHKTYGPAAEAMERYWITLDERWANLETQAGSIHAHPHVFTHELLMDLEEHLRDAERAARGHDGYEQRVHIARRGFTRAQYWRDWFDALAAGEIDAAWAIYNEWLAFAEQSVDTGDANNYELIYQRRFVGGITERTYDLVRPEDASPNRVVTVLPDEMRYARQPWLEERGVIDPPVAFGFDDGDWDTVQTYGAVLDAQGYPDYFGDMWYRTKIELPEDVSDNLALRFIKADRHVTVWVNGERVNDDPAESFSGSTIDVSGRFVPGAENQVTIRVRREPLPELYLGGIVKPVYLIEMTD